MQILLIRHGETPWNRSKRFQGMSDVRLSEEGRAQARLLRAHLRGEGFDAVHASDLTRAVETAQIVSGWEPRRIARHVGLREMNQGLLEGLTWEQGLAQYPRVIARWLERPTDAMIPGGESLGACAARAAAALREIRESGSARRVLIVSHNLAISAALALLLEEPLPKFRRFRQEPCALNRLDWSGRRPELKVCNDYAFLPPLYHPVRYGPHLDEK